MKKYLLPVLVCVSILTLVSGCDFFLALLGMGLGDVKVTMTLADLSPKLTLNQSGYLTNTDEYGWGVEIDIDGNSNTGEQVSGFGFDVRIALIYNTPGAAGDPAATGTLEELLGGDDDTYQYIGPTTYEWNGSQFEITYNIADAYIDGNTITFYTHSFLPELSDFSSSFRSRFFTLYNDWTDLTMDNSPIRSGNGSVTDAGGDTNPNAVVFVDILSGTVEFPLE